MNTFEIISNTAKNIGAIAGCVISCVTLLGLSIKPIRQKISKLIQNESHSGELEDKIDKIATLIEEHTKQDEEKQQAIANQNEAIKCLLRDSITKIYYKNLPYKEIKAYELEDLAQLYKSYIKLDGNSYVKTIYKQMTEDWKVIQ